MTSLANSKIAHYRARAAEARQKAEEASDPAVREMQLRDAEMWERMAQYEEKNPSNQYP